MADRTIKVVDPTDTRIADYINIRERDLLRERQTFICEGKTVLQVLVHQSRFPIKSLLILQNRLAGVADLIGSLNPDVPVYVAERSVMDAIAGFPMHRGVLAAARTTNEAPLQIDNGPIVVASALSNHDNVGAVFRNAAAFGAQAVLLDQHCCDPLYRKAIRVSVGGVLQVPFRRADPLDSIISDLTAQGFLIAALATDGDAELAHWRPPSKVALLVGSEGEGLPSDIIAKLTTLRIPMQGDFDSLNVATAAAIALHHLSAYKNSP